MSIGDLLKGFGSTRKEARQELIGEPNVGELFDKIFDILNSKYNGILKDSLLKQLELVAKSNDEESKRILRVAIKKDFKLTDEELDHYLFIVEFKDMYQNLLLYLELILAEINDANRDLTEEFGEIATIKETLKSLIEKHFGKIEEKPNEYSFSHNPSNVEPTYPVELSTNCNFLLYLSNVDELRENTVSSKSGKGQESMSRICKELKLLNQSNYEDLVANKKIHNINEEEKSGCKLTNYNSNFLRIGGGTTKIAHIKVKVLQSNIDVLRSKYKNINLRYLIMIVEFGDYMNEGINEYVLYSRFISNACKKISEMEEIIKIFNEPFTEETLEKACSMIESGADITRHLKENPMTPIKEGSSFRR